MYDTNHPPVSVHPSWWKYSTNVYLTGNFMVYNLPEILKKNHRNNHTLLDWSM